ncbi:hypothetical protein MASR2M78_19430 [Treponema sp.]
MRRLLVSICILLASYSAMAQNLERVVAIGDKDLCIMADLDDMLVGLQESLPEDTELLSRLQSASAAYKSEQILTKKRASFVVARGYKLSGSLLYTIFRNERYAFKMLVADGIFKASSSGSDALSGIDLLSFIGAVDQEYGAAR